MANTADMQMHEPNDNDNSPQTPLFNVAPPPPVAPPPTAPVVPYAPPPPVQPPLVPVRTDDGRIVHVAINQLRPDTRADYAQRVADPGGQLLPAPAAAPPAAPPAPAAPNPMANLVQPVSPHEQEMARLGGWTPSAAPPPGASTAVPPASSAPASEGVPHLLARPTAPPQAGGAPTGAVAPTEQTRVDAMGRQFNANQRQLDKDFVKTQQEDARAAQESAQVTMERQSAQAEIARHGSQEQARLLAESRQNAAKRQQAQEKASTKTDALASELKATVFDPNEYQKNLGVGGHIAGALAIILGGIGQGMLRSNHNVALDIIQRNIDRNIEAQKTNLGRKERMLAEARNDYRDLLADGHSQAEAEAMMRSAAWSAVQQQIQTAGMVFAPQETQAQLGATLAAAGDKALTYKKEAMQHAETNAIHIEGMREHREEFDLNKAIALSNRAAANKLPSDQAEKMDAGVNGIKTLLDVANKFNEATKDYVPGSNILGSLRGSGDTAQYQNARHDAAGAMAATFDPGARNNPTLIQRSMDSLPDARTTSHAAGMARFKNQFAEARNFLMTRIQTEYAAGRNVSAYAQQLQDLDRKASELGIGTVPFTESAGGR